MKNKKITCIALAVLTGSVSQFAFAGKDKMKTSKVEGSMHSTQGVARIAESRVGDLTTANDLIGSSVFDSNGEKIGTIEDVSFGRNVMAGLSMKSDNWSQEKKDKRSSDSWSSSNDAQSNDDETYSKQRSVEGSYASKDSRDSYNQTQSADGNMDKHSMKRDHAMSGRPESVVFISVGGLFGIGDDLVQVPASKISYDSSNERFVLQGHTVDEVTNVAKADEANFNENDYYSDNWYETTGYAPYANPYGSTSRAMRDFGSDEEMIRNAYRDDASLASLSSSIDIAQKDEKIVLSGTVESEQEKQRAEDLAKRETSLKVVNKLKVKDN